MKALVALLAGWCFALPLAAQAFPAKPIRFVVPFPGGFSDVLARQRTATRSSWATSARTR